MHLDKKTKTARDAIRNKTGKKGGIGIILGSGFGRFADRLKNVDEIYYRDIPHLAAPNVAGHKGRLVIGEIRDKNIFVFDGRLHLYEGHSVEDVVFPVRILNALGIKNLIVTCSSGGISNKLNKGDMFFIDDHINLLAVNPLTGLIKHAPAGIKQGKAGSDVFVDMTIAYERWMFKDLSKYAKSIGIKMQSGVLCSVSGPSYETPAEIKMLKTIGADAVCMSTVPEVIMAKYLKMKVLGLSLITNTIKNKHTTHADVVRTAKEGSKKFGDLLERAVLLFNER